MCLYGCVCFFFLPLLPLVSSSPWSHGRTRHLIGLIYPIPCQPQASSPVKTQTVRFLTLNTLSTLVDFPSQDDNIWISLCLLKPASLPALLPGSHRACFSALVLSSLRFSALLWLLDTSSTPLFPSMFWPQHQALILKHRIIQLNISFLKDELHCTGPVPFGWGQQELAAGSLKEPPGLQVSPECHACHPMSPLVPSSLPGVLFSLLKTSRWGPQGQGHYTISSVPISSHFFHVFWGIKCSCLCERIHVIVFSAWLGFLLFLRKQSSKD